MDSTPAGVVTANSGNGGGYQNWIIISDGSGYYFLQDQITQRFLESSTGTGPSIFTNVFSGDNYQKWSFSGDNIINKANGKYVDSNSNGDVYYLDQMGNDNQRWVKVYLADQLVTSPVSDQGKLVITLTINIDLIF